MSEKNGAWHLKAAEDLAMKGLQQCRTCGGTGTTERKVSKSAVLKEICGLSKGYSISVTPKVIDSRLRNLRVLDLRRLSERLGTDINGAAEWVERLIEEVSA